MLAQIWSPWKNFRSRTDPRPATLSHENLIYADGVAWLSTAARRVPFDR